MFEPGYTCTIDYGTDPSYTNLVYSDTSSTHDRATTITLSQDLQRDTIYYFIVSAESNSLCVRLRGRFRTGMVCCFRTFDGFTCTVNSQACQYLSNSQNVTISRSSVYINAKLYTIMLSQECFFNSNPGATALLVAAAATVATQW